VEATFHFPRFPARLGGKVVEIPPIGGPATIEMRAAQA
jgi:hypothetical protein